MICARVNGARPSVIGGDAAIDFIPLGSQQSDKEDVQIDASFLPTFLCGSFWAAVSSATATTFVCLSSFCKHAAQMGNMVVRIRHMENIWFRYIFILGLKKGQEL